MLSSSTVELLSEMSIFQKIVSFSIFQPRIFSIDLSSAEPVALTRAGTRVKEEIQYFRNGIRKIEYAEVRAGGILDPS